jgi:hypothetical protein
MNRCATCKHWEGDAEDGSGCCARISLEGKTDDPGHAYMVAIGDDETHAYADMYTGPDFGCVLHEPKEPTPES